MAEAGADTRSIDFPLEQLPEVDEHGTLVNAAPERVWDSLLTVLPRSFAGRLRPRRRCARLRGDGAPRRAGDDRLDDAGLHLRPLDKAGVLALEGQHRFSRYALVFRLEPTKDGKTLLRAETRAQFPGWRGRVYRALVIGTRGHVLAVNRILRAVRRRAERGV